LYLVCLALEAHVITFFNQFDFALNQVSRHITEKFMIDIFGFTPPFVIARSLANQYFKLVDKPRLSTNIIYF